MAKLISSFAEMIESRPAVSLHLHTPAHQGRPAVRGGPATLPTQLFQRDLPYFTAVSLRT